MLRVLQLVIIVGATLSLAMTFTDCPFHHLQHLENSISSGESGVGGVLTAIFSVIGAKQKSFIDISDTFMHNISTVDDIVQVFSTQSVPSVFDLLHVKYGMSTWWIMASLLKATEGYRPRVIVVEVNTMLGCRDEHDRFAFHRINSYPLISAQHFKLSPLKENRHYGGNPLAFKKLLNWFGYELIHCESTGVSCVFVPRDLLPQTCPLSFPLPQLTYPLLRPFDNQHASPVQLSAGLLKTLLATKSFSNSFPDKLLLELHTFSEGVKEHTALWNMNYRQFVGQDEFHLLTERCSCLCERRCSNVMAQLQEKILAFNHYRDNSVTVAYMDVNFTSVLWICDVIVHAEDNSSLCVDIADLYFDHFMHVLSRPDLIEDQEYHQKMWSLLHEGLKYDPHNPSIRAMYRYRNWNRYITNAVAEAASDGSFASDVAVPPSHMYSFWFTFIRGIDKYAGLGGGVCDNIRHRAKKSPLFFPLSSSDFLLKRLFEMEKLFMSHFISEDQYLEARYWHENTTSSDLLASRPYYDQEETVLHTLLPPCVSESAIVEKARRSIESVCTKRRTLVTVLVLSPMAIVFRVMSAEAHRRTNNTLHDFAQLNSEIVRKVGCATQGPTALLSCEGPLINLASGYLQEVVGNSGESSDEFWSRTVQKIYQRRLEMPEVVTLTDSLLSFTAPLWQGPLGNVEVVLMLLNPQRYVCSLFSDTKKISPETVASLWMLYFRAALSSARHFSVVHVVTGNSVKELKSSFFELRPFGKNLFGDDDVTIYADSVDAGWSGLTDIANDDSIHEILPIPEWARVCYESICRERSISPELCWAHI